MLRRMVAAQAEPVNIQVKASAKLQEKLGKKVDSILAQKILKFNARNPTN